MDERTQLVINDDKIDCYITLVHVLETVLQFHFCCHSCIRLYVLFLSIYCRNSLQCVMKLSVSILYVCANVFFDWKFT